MANSGFIGKKGQAATEYLTLLAAVLIVGLLAYATLGAIFPAQNGNAQAISDIQAAQQPVRISAIRNYVQGSEDVYLGIQAFIPYIQIKNNEPYPIILRKFILNAHSGNGSSDYVDHYYNYESSLGDSLNTITIQPGETACFGNVESYFPGHTDCPQQRMIFVSYDPSGHDFPGGYGFASLATHCNIVAWSELTTRPDYTVPPEGYITLPDFAIEYSLVVRNKEIIKTSYLGDVRAECAGWLTQ